MQYPPDQPYPGQQPPQQPNTFYPSQHPTFPQQQPYYPPYGAPPPPQQPYPPQYPPQPGYPPPQPPKKKNKTGLWVSIGIAVLVIFACIASGSHGSSSPDTTATASTSNTTNATVAPQPTQAPTATPKPLKWTSTHAFKGNGEQKTAIFAAPDDWAIIWTCNPASSFGGTYNVIVTVYNSDGTMADVAINSICKTGTINGQTEEHQSGQVYLDISSEGDWAVQVLEMK